MSKKEDLKRVKPKHPNKKTRLTIGIPISVNSMYYNQRSRGMTAKAKRYMKETYAKVLDFVNEENYKSEKIGVWQYLDIVIYMPDKIMRDSHNCLKLLMDSIEGLLFENDYYIMPRIQSVELDRNNPRLELVLSNQSKAQRRNMKEYVSNKK